MQKLSGGRLEMAFNVSCESTEIMLIDHGRSVLFFPGWPNTTTKTKLADHAGDQPTSMTARPPRTPRRHSLLCVPAPLPAWGLPAACQPAWPGSRLWQRALQAAVCRQRALQAAVCQQRALQAAVCRQQALQAAGCRSHTRLSTALPTAGQCGVDRTYSSKQLWVCTRVSQLKKKKIIMWIQMGLSLLPKWRLISSLRLMHARKS